MLDCRTNEEEEDEGLNWLRAVDPAAERQCMPLRYNLRSSIHVSDLNLNREIEEDKLDAQVIVRL